MTINASLSKEQFLSTGFGKHGHPLRCVVAALLCAAIAMLIAIAPQGAEAAFADKTTCGDDLAEAAENEFSTMKRNDSEYMRYGEKYWTWAYRVKGGTLKREDWCAYFVAYCAQQADLFNAGIYPSDWKTFAGVGKTRRWLIDYGCPVWQNDETYIPRRGDLAIQYIGGAPNHIEIVTSFSKGKVHTIGGNAGDSSEMMRHEKNLGETWKEFIRPSFGVKAAVSLSKAKLTGIVNKAYNGTNRYQSPSDVKLFVGGQRLSYNVDYSLVYSKSNIANLYRRPTEGHGAWVYARAKGNYKSFSIASRYKITSDTTYFLSKMTKNGWDLRLTQNSTTMQKLKKTGYALKTTMHTRPFSLQPITEYYNAKLGLHRYTFSASVGKRLVKCGYKAKGIVAYSDPTAYEPNAGKLYAATYHDAKTDTTDTKRFKNCGQAWDYGSLPSMDKAMKKKFGLVRTYEMIEYPDAVTW